MYHLIALFGPAGSGKDTILKMALEKISRLSKMVSYTTRPMREGEVDGKDYHFISTEEFEDKVLNQDLIEAAVFNGWGYGSSLDCLNKDKINIVALDPTRLGLLTECKDIKVYPYFIKVSDKNRLLRQLKREENPDVDEIVRRFGTDKKDYQTIPFSYQSLPNENKTDLKAAIETLRALVKTI